MKPSRKRPVQTRALDVQGFLASTRSSRVVRYKPDAVIFSQGDPSDMVLWVQEGTVKLSVLSRTGKEAIVAMLGAGDFLGEGALVGQPVRIASVTAVTECAVLAVEKQQMLDLLHSEPGLSDQFIAYVLARNIRVEADLVDQLFNSSEKRLARALLLLARYGREERPHRVLPKVSQETLAEMVGTTRSRVNFFMNKFRKLGFIAYNGELKVNDSLLSVVLHD